MKSSPHTFLENSVILFSWRNMGLGCTKMKGHTLHSVFDVIHDGLKFIVTVDVCDAEAVVIVEAQHSVQGIT